MVLSSSACLFFPSISFCVAALLLALAVVTANFPVMMARPPGGGALTPRGLSATTTIVGLVAFITTLLNRNDGHKAVRPPGARDL